VAERQDTKGASQTFSFHLFNIELLLSFLMKTKEWQNCGEV